MSRHHTHCTEKGRVVYNRKPHLYKVRDLERITNTILRQHGDIKIKVELFVYFIDGITRIVEELVLDIFIGKVLLLAFKEFKLMLEAFKASGLLEKILQYNISKTKPVEPPKIDWKPWL